MKYKDIDAGQGQAYTVIEVEPGLFQSVFPSWLHEKSQLHSSEADAWDYIADVREDQREMGGSV